MSASRNAFIIGGFAAVAGVGWFLGSRPNETVELAFLAVGQGDCAILQQGKSAIMIDAGPTESSAKFTILPELRQRGITEIDTIFLSHPDEDHIAGIGVIKERFPNVKIAMSAEFKDDSTFLKRLSDWHLGAKHIDWLPTRTRGSIGRFSLDIYCPPMTETTKDNDGSMIVKLQDGAATAVFSGDASAEEEVEAAPVGDWSAEVMHVGHHGSKTSSSFTWLGEVKPIYAVVSCGKENRYGHPNQAVVDRIEEAKAKVLRTDQSGTITFTIRGGRFVPAN